MTVFAMVVLAVGVLLCIAAVRTRARRLRPHDIVVLDGVPCRVSLVSFRFGEPDRYEFENLGEWLARSVLVDGDSMTLGQLLVQCGWRPPTPGGS